MNGAATSQGITSFSLMGLTSLVGAGISPQAVNGDTICFGGLDQDVVVEPLIGIDGEPIDYEAIGGFGAMASSNSPRTVVDRYNGILQKNLGELISGRLHPAVALTEGHEGIRDRLNAGWDRSNPAKDDPPVRRFDSMELGELLSALRMRTVPGASELADWLAIKGRNLNLSDLGFREPIFASAAIYAGLGLPNSFAIAEMLFERIAKDYERFDLRRFGDISAEDAIMYEMAAQMRDRRAAEDAPANPLRIQAARAWASSPSVDVNLPTILFKMIRAMKDAWLGEDLQTLHDIYRRYAEATFTLKSVEERAKDKLRTAWARQILHESNPDARVSEPLKGVISQLAEAAEVLPQVREYLEGIAAAGSL